MTDEKYEQQLTKTSCFEKQYYHASPNYILREIAGDSLLVSVGAGVADFCGIVKLNPSAKIIWNALQRGVTKNELILELQNHFFVSEEKASEDIQNTLMLLEGKGMIYIE